VAVGDLVVQLGRHVGQRPAQPDQPQPDVGEGDRGRQAAVGVAGVDDALQRVRRGRADRAEQLAIHVELVEHERDQGRRAQVERRVHVGDQGGEAVGLLGQRVLGRPGRLDQFLAHDGADQGLAVGEAAVDGADADPGPPGHVLERGARPLLDEDVPGRDQDLGLVAAGVGAQGPCPAGDALL
jgi:hypothetical protein